MRALKDLVDVAERAAERAANFVRGARAPEAGDWTEKSRHDFVTQVDRDAEELIAETLTGLVPGTVVVGEELSPAAEYRGEVVWVVDPLDGTTNYLHGYPQYAVSIGALVDGVLSLGVVHDVARDVAYRAARGQGAWCGGAKLAVSELAEPSRALVGTGFPVQASRGPGALSAPVRRGHAGDERHPTRGVGGAGSRRRRGGPVRRLLGAACSPRGTSRPA